MDNEGHVGYLPAGISVEELLTAAEDLQQMLPTPMTSRPGGRGNEVCLLASQVACWRASLCLQRVCLQGCLQQLAVLGTG